MLLQHRSKTTGDNNVQHLQMHQSHKQQGMASVLLTLIRTDGFLSIFDGLVPELVRGMLSGALMLMAKERIDRIVFAVLLRSNSVA